PGLEVWALDVGDEAPLEARPQALLDLGNTLRRRVAGENDLFSRFVKIVEGMEEFLLGPLLSSDELDVIDQQEVDRPVARPEGGRVVVADRIDKLIGEVLRREINDHRAGKHMTGPVTDRAEQAPLAESGTATAEEGVVCARRKFRDGLTGGLGELVGRSDDEGVEGIAGIQPFGR